MFFLKQSTAVDVLIGPFVDESDGVTPETALTLAQADIKLSKNGQALAQKSDATAATHDADGYYNCELDATDTATVGTLVLVVNESGALPVRHEFQIVPANVYDSLFAGSDKLQVHTDEITANLITSSVIAANAIGASELASDAVTEIQSGLATAAALATVDSVVDAIKAVTDNLPDSGALTTIDGNIDAILVDTGTTIPGLIAALNDPSANDVRDAVWAQTLSEPAGVPAWTTGDVQQALEWLLALARNKVTQTSTTQTLRNDDDDGNIATAGISDNGTTFTRDEWS